MGQFAPNLASRIDAITIQMANAFNARDAVALASLYSDTAILMPPNEPMVSGRSQIQTWFERVLERVGSVRIVPVESTIAGDRAFQVGTFTSSANSADGSSSVEGRGTEVTGKYVLLLTNSGGNWTIQYDIWSLDQPTG